MLTTSRHLQKSYDSHIGPSYSLFESLPSNLLKYY